MDSEFPILEFDDEREALIEPSRVIEPIDTPERCVLPIYHTGIAKLTAPPPSWRSRSQTINT
jgi:hypothetical protein